MESKLVEPRLCVWCREPFTPHRRRGGFWTIACCPDHARRHTGRLAMQPGGSHAKAIAARKANAAREILEKVATLTPVEAFRLGMKRGYQLGYQALPMDAANRKEP